MFVCYGVWVLGREESVGDRRRGERRSGVAGKEKGRRDGCQTDRNLHSEHLPSVSSGPKWQVNF